ELRRRLKGLGLSEKALNAAWPGWWTDEAEASASGRAELRFSVARRLGLDPGSLLEREQAPRFLWREEARFKHLLDEDDLEQAGITSFGRSVASALLNALPERPELPVSLAPLDLRAEILAGRPYVDFVDLLVLCWAVGVPVVHLRVFPWPQKRMAAMT